MTVLHQSTGVIRYTTNWLVLDTDNEICRYYRRLIPKHVGIKKQRYPGHITVLRPKYEEEILYPEYWGKYQGKTVSYFYSPIVQNSEYYYWLNCFSVELEEIRAELGLYVDDRFTTPPKGFRKTFHITIGNCKDLDQEPIS